MQIRFRGVTNATYGTVFLLDDTLLAVTVPLRREGGEGAGRKAAAAGPEGALRAEGGGGTVAVAMDAKASAAMEEEAREPAGGEALIGSAVHESPTPKHDSISGHDPDWRHSAPRVLRMQKEIEPVG